MMPTPFLWTSMFTLFNISTQMQLGYVPVILALMAQKVDKTYQVSTNDKISILLTMLFKSAPAVSPTIFISVQFLKVRGKFQWLLPPFKILINRGDNYRKRKKNQETYKWPLGAKNA